MITGRRPISKTTGRRLVPRDSAVYAPLAFWSRDHRHPVVVHESSNLSAAFRKADRKRLGSPRKIFSWLALQIIRPVSMSTTTYSDYSMDRKFSHWMHTKVVYNRHNSAAETVESGIPQGTVIGPASFLTFIDHITDDIYSAVYLFADDTKAHRSINQFHDCNQLQSDTDRLDSWSRNWLLHFNQIKCSDD